MKHEQLISAGHRLKHSKLPGKPMQYVDANDLRALLKLGLSLHAVGEPNVLLGRALQGLLQLACGDVWAVALLPASKAGRSSSPIFLQGGNDSIAARELAARIKRDCRDRGTAIGTLATGNHIPGRVASSLEDGRTIHSVLRLEAAESAAVSRTLISIGRGEKVAAFGERERRLLKLFHSQSAWLLVKLTDPS